MTQTHYAHLFGCFGSSVYRQIFAQVCWVNTKRAAHMSIEYRLTDSFCVVLCCFVLSLLRYKKVLYRIAVHFTFIIIY